MVQLLIEFDEARLPRDDGLGLTPFTPADAGALCELDRDPEHRRRFELPADLAPSVAHSLAVIDAWALARAKGLRYAFAVRRHGAGGARGELVGGVELWPSTLRTGNLAYWVHPPHRRRGHARRAVLLACRWAAAYSPLERLEILVDPGNVPSQRVALAAGFAQAGARAGRLLFVLELARSAAASRR